MHVLQEKSYDDTAVREWDTRRKNMMSMMIRIMVYDDTEYGI